MELTASTLGWGAFGAFIYVYFAWCLAVIGQKLEDDATWMAWVPILNIYYMVRLAARPAWMFLVLWVPVVNLWALVTVWGDIAERRNKPRWAGFFMLVPVLNYMVLTRLAFVETTS